MPRGYTQPNFLTRREQRAAYEQEREMDFLSQAQQLASTIQQSRMREAEFNARVQQQELENARNAAKEIIAERDRQHTIKALPLLTQFSANKPGSEAELAQIVAELPGAFSDPLVKQLFADRKKEVDAVKDSADKYKTTTGMTLPVTQDGQYDLPRAEARLAQVAQITDARSKGLIKSDDEAKTWMSMDEYAFNNPTNGFGAWAAGETERINALNAASKYQEDKTRRTLEVGQAEIKASEALKPDPMVVTDPNEFAKRAKDAQDMAVAGANRVQGAAAYSDQKVVAPSTPRQSPEDWVTRFKTSKTTP